jgi:hypothetical protein
MYAARMKGAGSQSRTKLKIFELVRDSAQTMTVCFNSDVCPAIRNVQRAFNLRLWHPHHGWLFSPPAAPTAVSRPPLEPDSPSLMR